MAETLNSLGRIASLDGYGMGEILENFPEHCKEALNLGLKADLSPLERALKRISKIVFLGMGGSAVGGGILKDWAYGQARVPIEICRDSVIPGFVDEETLTIAVSYSGNTYETLEAFHQALSRGSPALAVSSGGSLAELSSARRLAHIQVPKGLQPRAALPYLMLPIGIALERLGVFKGFRRELEASLSLLEEAGRKLKRTVPLEENPAKKLALSLHGSLPVVYGFREYSTIAYRFKTQLNENSKIFCKHDIFPELNHNEIVGWEKPQPFLSEKVHLLILRDGREPEEVNASIEAFKEVVGGRGFRITEVYAEGKLRLSRMLYLIYLGDYTSFYLAILNGVDPTPISSITTLKRKLSERIGG